MILQVAKRIANIRFDCIKNGIHQEVTGQLKAVVTDKWILCPVCGAKTRTQILDDTELKHFPLFCPKCKESFIINVKDHIMDYQSIARR